MQLPFWLAHMLLYSYVHVFSIRLASSDNSISYRDVADCTIPPAFNQRIRNALKANPKSVKLSGLVGVGGLWYAFGRMILGM